MKKIEVEVVSKEIIQPSTPTPESLRSYQLSFLDQLTPTLYNPLVLFYPKLCDTEANKIIISDQLKQSISKALTYFYPLAGRIISDSLSVDCNDEGIRFQEARAKCQLSEVIDNPVPSELNKLIPFRVLDMEEFLMGIQFNVFECGGIGVGVCITHKIGDALSFFTFINLWSAIARGDKTLVTPLFDSATLFPPRDLKGYRPIIPRGKENIVTKRFVFTASKIGEIRGKYPDNTSSENPVRPTRIEALSAFIWSRFSAATEVTSKPDTLCTVNHMINLRTRTEPPLPEYSFGNLYSNTMTVLSKDNIGENCHDLVTQMRESMKGMDKEFVKRLQGGYTDHLNNMKEIVSGHAKLGKWVNFVFTSLCRFPLYEADFGWGKPVWVGPTDRELKNAVTFMDTAAGNGIEAWISLEEEDMAKLESDEEILAYVAPTSF